ncbi:MAG: hypothetical protein LBF93_08760 [Zoogloeaceae bacterium]|jgi:hypothetical protein|nr:hypothetical protein [Zoogloeaceae bacterium]
MNVDARNVTLPRSYMTDEEKAGMPSQNAVYVCESVAADKAGDDDASWAWLALCEMPESAKQALLTGCGREFLETKGIHL